MLGYIFTSIGALIVLAVLIIALSGTSKNRSKTPRNDEEKGRTRSKPTAEQINSPAEEVSQKH
tara:strand:- start:473 stop:661 length:189 start_codon:yes stop_codon:yes gene_type:complete